MEVKTQHFFIRIKKFLINDGIFRVNIFNIFKLNAGKGYDRIRDFKKGEDKIDISDFDLESLRIVDTGKHTRVYKGSKDLLAIIYNEDEISLSDNSYLIQ